LLYLLYTFKPRIETLAGSAFRSYLVLGIVPLTFVIMGGRLFSSTYFDGFRLKSNTELRTVRGRGVCFPASTAREIDEVVEYIQELVPADGYFFAHSYAGSSFLFLADRNNPSGAQFWGGVGVSDEEKARTLEAIKEKNVYLIVTSTRDLAAERYTPMREYIDSNYHQTMRIGEIVILEQNVFIGYESGKGDQRGIGHLEYGMARTSN